jgi:hypothetical protein
VDGSRFDRIAREMATSRSRRSLLKGLTGSLAAAIAGTAGLRGADAAAGCKREGQVCRENPNCCSGLCGKDASGRRVCACPAGTTPCNGMCVNPATAFQTDKANCGACGNACRGGQICVNGTCANKGCTSAGQCPQPTGACQTATCISGACGITTAANGTPCNDGNLCTTGDVCTNGVCGGTPVVCTALDQCHDAGTCDPATGVCTNPDKANGTACTDPDPCTTNDVCTSGVCRGTPTNCPSPTLCQVSVACDPTSGSCVTVNQPDGTLCGANDPCSHDICQAGQCLTNQPKPIGTACNDQNSCTQTDACDGAGACVGAAPVTCPATDVCHGDGVCNTGTGQCGDHPILPGTCFIGGVCYIDGDANPANPCQVCDSALSPTTFSSGHEGVACNDGNKCTTGDICVSGVCTGVPVVCTAQDQCHTAGTCNPTTGLCSNPNQPNGTACNDNNACTSGTTCQAGICQGATPISCEDGNRCTIDFCDNTRGGCVHERVSPLSIPGDVCHVEVCDPVVGGAVVLPSGACDGTCVVDELCGPTSPCCPGQTCTFDSDFGFSICITPDGSTCTTDDGCGSGLCHTVYDFCYARDVCNRDYSIFGGNCTRDEDCCMTDHCVCYDEPCTLAGYCYPNP